MLTSTWLLHLVVFLFQVSKCSDAESDYVTDDNDSVDNSTLSSEPEVEEQTMESLVKALEDENFFKRPPQYHASGPSAPAAEFSPSTHLSCRDPDGNAVDWWFIYKEDNSSPAGPLNAKGTRFLYYSSAHVKQNIPNPTPLRDDKHITDYRTSPLLQTIYQNYEHSVWLAWNDQTKDGLDAYGNMINGIKHAHSKGFFAIKALFEDNRQDKVNISSYAIMHSLPNFPNIPMQPKNNGIYKHFLPHPPDIFGTNIDDNAQNFMCFNFERAKVPYSNGEVVYNASNEAQPSHVLFLQKYLKTIHPAIVGTNFDDFDPNFAHWRQYFSFFKMPFNQAHAYFAKSVPFSYRYQAYSAHDLPSALRTGPESNLFPLSKTSFFQNGYYYQPCKICGQASQSSSSNQIFQCKVCSMSRWDAAYSSKNGCVPPKTETDHMDSSCFAEAVITSTAYQDQITFKIFAKHGASCIDLYDDWAALQLAELQTHFKRDYSKQIPPKHAMLVQTWQDPGTLPKKQSKKIYDKDGNVMATVHINNVGSVTLPVEQFSYPGARIARSKTITSYKRDHSKWLLGFTIDSFNGDVPAHLNEAQFIPMLCFGDLNRTKTQAKLKDKKQGRGGGLACTTHRGLWGVLASLQPTATLPKFANSKKEKALAIQNRLRGHCSSSFNSSAHDRIKLDSLRSPFFSLLRLRKDSLKTNQSVDFVSFLSEMSQFLVRARDNAEKTVFYAFQKFYHRVARGKVNGAAKRVWEKIHSHTNLLQAVVPILRRLPALVLDRHEPQAQNAPDKTVTHDKKTDKFSILDYQSEEYIEHMKTQLGREFGTQTEADSIEFGTQTGESEQVEELISQKAITAFDSEDEDYDDDDEDYIEGESEEDSDEDDGEDEDEKDENEEDNVNSFENYDNDDDSRDSENYILDYDDCENTRHAYNSYSSEEDD